MKIVFLSNYYNHHQRSLCENLNLITNKQFTFIESEDISNERLQLGWKKYKGLSFVKNFEENKLESLKIINDADVVMIGNASLNIIDECLNNKKLVFKYSERIFKHRYNILKWIPRLYRFWKNYGRRKSMYLLCASAYTSMDFAMHGTFIGKAYKWGYFPKCVRYSDVDSLIQKKNIKEIVWCGRLIDWKHPDDAIKIAHRLKSEGYDFHMKIIGTGEMSSELEKMVRNFNLEKNVCFIGAITPEEVRQHMEKAGIFIFTSDRREGWGAVLNEAMNSGCAVIASHAIGSVPYLINDRVNGIIYRDGDLEDLFVKTKTVLENPHIQYEIGKEAYRTITQLWNAEIASQRLLSLIEEISDHGYCDLYNDGPCSKAGIVKNNWYKSR